MISKLHMCMLMLKLCTAPIDPRSGGKDLKSSQEYPRPFGAKVAELHLDYMEAVTRFAFGTRFPKPIDHACTCMNSNGR